MYRLLPRVLILAQGVFFFAFNSNAQILDLPRESPKAQVSQRIGVTDIAILYSRPLVKGRKIWGGVVPLGDIWRAGANENTTIEFSDPVTVEGKPLPKGVYGLHMIPNENEWTVIFSKNSTSWGSKIKPSKSSAPISRRTRTTGLFTPRSRGWLARARVSMKR